MDCESLCFVLWLLFVGLFIGSEFGGVGVMCVVVGLVIGFGFCLVGGVRGIMVLFFLCLCRLGWMYEFVFGLGVKVLMVFCEVSDSWL